MKLRVSCTLGKHWANWTTFLDKCFWFLIVHCYYIEIQFIFILTRYPVILSNLLFHAGIFLTDEYLHKSLCQSQNFPSFQSAYVSFFLPFQTGYATQNNTNERDNTHPGQTPAWGEVSLFLKCEAHRTSLHKRPLRWPSLVYCLPEIV